ncbi:TniB family NTP-binding protein [Rhodococcus koreensis]|jgi:type II secretory pathway predicted ATPase ExeA|uniref:TniB protein n=1 Tax=Rhodococcus koreensis TaxID=99653 RepID=A0A1H4I747_9NOCA|nr:TniB family NTP-binding protein [Rhodococcus koreensis]SEB29904.1 TniB protein [Rhodococcus koreensis]
MVDTAAPEDFDHLHAPVRPVAALPAEERIRHIRAERWIGYPRARAAVEQLDILLHWPARQRMPNLLIIGPTNNGKSMIVEKFRRRHPPVSGDDAEQIPVLCVQMPSDPSISRFYVAVLTALGAPLRPHRRIAELEQLTLTLLRRTGVQLLVIDEIHNILAGRDNVRREFLNLLRYLGNELKIPLAGVGTRDAYLAIRTDDQLENRFLPISLPPWGDDPDTRSLLASFAASYPLRGRSHLSSDEMTGYLLSRCEGTIGELAMLLTAAAVAAVETGEEAINHRTLTVADYTGPSDRRRQFERELL